MTDVIHALEVAALLALFITCVSLPFIPPKKCSLCHQEVPRRRLVDHFFTVHQESR